LRIFSDQAAWKQARQIPKKKGEEKGIGYFSPLQVARDGVVDACSYQIVAKTRSNGRKKLKR
jgi:hypothetical protein